MPLQPILVDARFMQWGLAVIGSINTNSSQAHSYILTYIDYFTKWKESKTLKKANTEELISFIEENILSHFCVLGNFITDIGSIFVGSKFIGFYWKYGVTMVQYSNYYLQGNGLAESTNKTTIQVLKKTI